MAGIIFVAFNLRPAITSVGPLIGAIRDETGISNSAAGLLTTLPLVAFALLSPFVPRIAQKLGSEWSILLGLTILGAGIAARSLGMLPPLYIGTVLIGLGVGLCNVLLPGMVKEKFPQKVGLLTGIYTFSMGICAGLAPGFSIPLAENLGLGWRLSLGVWTILIFIAIIVWLPQIRERKKKTAAPKVSAPKGSIWSSPIAWQVTLFMGLQSMVYFSATTWLPEILHSQGREIAAAGWMVTVLQFSGLPVNFIIPVLADRLPNQKGIALGIGLFTFAGLMGLLMNVNAIISNISIVLLGIGLGAAISHSLTLIGLRAENAKQAASLSGMAQSVGYLLAGAGPILIGSLYDLFHSWTVPLIFLMIITAIFTISGIGAGRDQFVLQGVQHKQKKSATTSA
ncbi:CynX/NimT family MFS transporter [Cytobacillus firmus]|uniref:CynX/NimT family MFS transporter n=1 Tax=Cytobacillus firmus TaxID=1399 RepID=UPI0024C0EDF0|nr:MFS transporter [Cytobacillus firmus]WHY64356.1 MFS transporter [Cytobacillus firmus]